MVGREETEAEDYGQGIDRQGGMTSREETSGGGPDEGLTGRVETVSEGDGREETTGGAASGELTFGEETEASEIRGREYFP